MSADEAPADQLRKRAAQNRAKLWLLLGADRWLVTGVLLAVVFAILVGVGYYLPAAEHAIRSGDSVDTLFQGFLTATITGVTLVLTLNQVVLSQELGAVDDQRERMSGAMQFRQDIADAIDAPVSPARPAQVLRGLIQTTEDRADRLQSALPETADKQLQNEVTTLTRSVRENASQTAPGLDNAQFGDFDVIASALNFNYSWKLHAAQRLRARYHDALSADATTALDELIAVLELFGPAREHFKTLYFQWELINLSRRILWTALPALLVSGSMIAFFDSATYRVVIGNTETLIVVIAGGVTIAAVPFFILLAYIMRIATIAKHTLSIGPFVLRETDGLSDVEWDQ